MAVKSAFIRGSVVRYVHIPAAAVDTQLLEDATRRGELRSNTRSRQSACINPTESCFTDHKRSSSSLCIDLRQQRLPRRPSAKRNLDTVFSEDACFGRQLYSTLLYITIFNTSLVASACLGLSACCRRRMRMRTYTELLATEICSSSNLQQRCMQRWASTTPDSPCSAPTIFRKDTRNDTQKGIGFDFHDIRQRRKGHYLLRSSRGDKDGPRREARNALSRTGFVRVTSEVPAASLEDPHRGKRVSFVYGHSPVV